MLLVWAEVYFSVDDVSFQRKVYAKHDLLECDAAIQETLALLQGFDPGYHVYQITDQQGNVIDGPKKYYFELNKDNLVDLFSSVVVFDTVAANVWGCAAFPDVFVQESPRKTWSHNK